MIEEPSGQVEDRLAEAEARGENCQCGLGKTADTILGRPLRVLHLIAQGNLAGTEMCAALLARGQAGCGLRPAVASLYRTGPIEAILTRYRLHVFHLNARTGHDRAACRRFVELIRSFKPDVLHAHDVRPWASILGWLIHRGPQVLTIHNQMPVGRWERRMRWVYRVARWSYSGFVGPSAATLQSVRRVVPLPASRCSVIPNGIPVADFRPQFTRAAHKRELGCPPDAPVVGLVGRQSAQKGVDDFLRTARGILRELPQARFWIFGEGEDLDRHVALARDLGIAGSVRFWGNQTNIQRWYWGMDLYLMTSRWEPFGLVILEAMAAGVPVLGFIPEAGGLLEVVRNGETAVLLPKRDPIALARLAITTLRDDAFRQQLVSAALEDVQRRFDLPVMVDRYLELYTGLLKKGQQRTVEYFS